MLILALISCAVLCVSAEPRDTSVCNLAPVATPFSCSAYIPKYTFSAESAACEPYVYGGCGGTANLFNSLRECQEACGFGEEDDGVLRLLRKREHGASDALTQGDPCSLPVEVGRCLALFHRYAFYPSENACRLFSYGGCGGNANNFMTLDECERACVPGRNVPEEPQSTEASQEATQLPDDYVPQPPVPAEVPIGDTGSTENTGPGESDNGACSGSRYMKHYYELGCKPVFEGDNNCPSRFDCQEFQNRDASKCYHDGKAYEVDSELETDPKCLAACRCTKGYDGKVGFTCASVECPELFMGPLEDSSCVRQYTPDLCCSTDTLCPPNTTEAFKCEYEGKTYLEGERMDVKEACKECYCQKGFDGRITEPWCTNIACNIDIHHTDDIQRGCVPIYFETGCCPIEMLCPGENDRVVPRDDLGGNSSTGEGECVFGSLRFRPGDKLSKKQSCVECECSVPPQLTCVRRRCPSPPSDGNCTPRFSAEECCPEYDCTGQPLIVNNS